MMKVVPGDPCFGVDGSGGSMIRRGIGIRDAGREGVVTMEPDTIIAACGRVNREWGSYGYRVESVEQIGWTGGVTLHVVHTDGSRFTVSVDRWGNPREVSA